MIQIKNLTPHVYTDQSRDFQFIGRLFDIALNSVKTNSENLYNLPFNDNTDTQLSTLMSLTLGFKSKHHYNVKQLKAICSCFSEILKYKGTLYALDIAGKALLNAEGIVDEMFIERNLDDKYVLNIYVPQTLSDTNLLEDIFDYVLPAGMSYTIIRELHLEKEATTLLTTSDKVTVYNNSNTAATGDITDVLDSTTSVVTTKDNIATLKTSLSNGTELQAIPGAIGNMTVIQPQNKNEE